MTEEQKESRKRNMARAREARRAKQAAELPPIVDEAEVEPPPTLMPALGQERQEAPTVPDDPGGEVVEIAEPPADPFERFLAVQDAETRELLSDLDLRVIYEAEVKKAAELRREAARRAARTRAAHAAQAAAGLISPKEAAEAEWEKSMNQKVLYTPTIPRDANDHPIDVGYRVNGRIFYDGQEAVMTRGEFLSLREQEWRARNHEMDFEGKGRLSEQRRLSAGSLTAKL